MTMGAMKLRIECHSCRATGLYSGMCEPEGIAVICLRCNGTGFQLMEYKPFIEIKPAHGVKWVQRSRGSFIGTGVGPVGDRISYADFKKGKRP
jgi:hypothetical protein